MGFFRPGWRLVNGSLNFMDRDVGHADIPYRSSSIRYFDRQADRDGDCGKPPLPINAHPLRQLLLGMKDWAFSKTAQAGRFVVRGTPHDSQDVV